MTKPELRKLAREKLSRLTRREAAEKSAAIRESIGGNRAWREASTVCLFAAHGMEPDVDLLWKHAPGKRICYPRVEGRDLELVAVTAPEALAVSKWNLREPPAAAGVPLSEIDLVLVPGLAFTRDGGRLGRGGGFYDRLLGRPLLRARRIGICFEVQILESLPLEGHDQRVDEVLTELS